jgi:DNA-binding NarL/FixJ family response regulator
MREQSLATNSAEGFAYEENESSRSLPLPDVALIGSALSFSGRLLEVLRSEFPEIAFRRFASPAEMKTGHRGVRLIVAEHSSAPGIVDLVRNLKRAFPEAAIAVAYTSLDAAPELRDRSILARTTPALSILPMKISLEAWLSIFRLVLCGERFIPAEVINAWNQEAGGEERTERPGRDPAGTPPTPAIPLTPREMQVLPLMAEGKQNKTIADVLGLSEHTVKLHTHNIFVKLKVNNRTCAAEWYRSHGQAAFGRRSDRDDDAAHPR